MLPSAQAQGDFGPSPEWRTITWAPNWPVMGTVTEWDPNAMDYLPVVPQPTGAQPQHESGEDWWYAHCNIYENGQHVGYAAAGYVSWVNWEFEDLINNCNSWGLGTDACDPIPTELETMERRKSAVIRQAVARFDLKGEMLWCRPFMTGTFYDIIQDSNGDLVAVGETNNNAEWPDTSPMDIPVMYNPGLPLGSDISTIDCQLQGLGWFAIKWSMVKLDLNGDVNWMNVYGGPEDALNGWELSSRGNDLVEIDLNGSVGYYSVGHAKPDPTFQDQAFAMRLDVNGNVHDRHFFLPNDPMWVLAGLSPNNTDEVRLMAVAGEPGGGDALAVVGYMGIAPRSIFVMAFNEDVDPYASIKIASSQTHPDLLIAGHQATGIQHTTGVGMVTVAGQPTIIWPTLANYSGGSTPTGGRSIAQLWMHSFTVGSAGIPLQYEWTTDLGEVRAYDLQADVTPTADGNVVVASSKWPSGYSENAPFNYSNGLSTAAQNCLLTDHAFCGMAGTAWETTNVFDYWNTDAFLAKLDATDGSIRWRSLFDADELESTCFPGNLKRQECIYKVSEAADGGLVISGNTGDNFDDSYIAKLHPDCNSDPAPYMAFEAGHPLDPDGVHVLSANETWTSDMNVRGTIIIPDGILLTIDGATIQFADSRQSLLTTRLVVQPGGELIVKNDALLTSRSNCPNSMWDGVQVHGIWNAAQDPVANSAQGSIALTTGAGIENARTAILLADGDPNDPTGAIIKESTGGFVRAYNALFRNNRHDVVFRSYEHRDGSNGPPLPNRSTFTECSFTTTNALADPTSWPKAHVYMDHVRGIRFSGCTWQGTSLPFDEVRKIGIGIRSLNSSFTVSAKCNSTPPQGSPCMDLTRSSFTGLLYGVVANTIKMDRTFLIDQTDFNLNTAGIRMENIMDASITRCTFDVAEPPLSGWIPSPYGIYADQCTGFEIEENDFTTTQPTGDYQKVGLVIKDSGIDANRYYNNAFDGLHCGTILEGNNGDGTTVTSGLQFKCNDYGDQGNAENIYDIAITGADPTVSLKQGTDFNEESPAGNTFSQTCNTGDNDIHVDASGAPLPMFTYVHHDVSLSAGFNVEPTCYSPPINGTTWINEAFNTGYSSKEVACPSDLGRDRAKFISKQLAIDAEADLQLSLAAYQSAKDDGDTEGLYDIINEATTSLAIRNPMLNVAPEIGVECFEAAFERLYDPLTPYHLTQVLVANSPLQAEVLEMTYNSSLDEVYVTMVDQAQGGEINILDLLEGEQAEFAHIKAGHLGDLSRNTWLDSIDIDIDISLDSLRMFNDEPGMGSELRLAALEQAADDPVALYDVAERNEQLEHSPLLYTGLKKLALAEQANGWDAPDANTLNWLYATADQREVIGSAFAQAWLNALGEDQPEEIIILPDPYKSFQASQQRGRTRSEHPLLLLFPNPASNDGFRAAYHLPADLPNATLTFRDMLGRTIWSYTSGTGVQLIDVPVHQLPDGLYFCSLMVDDAPLVTEKLMIAR